MIWDPHFWFDPNRVALAITEIEHSLKRLDPEHADKYQSSANKYLETLEALDHEIETLVQAIPRDNRHLVTTHESLGYLQDRYGLEVLVPIIPNITTEDGVTPKQLVHVIEEINEHGIKSIFIESETPTQAAEIIAQESGASLVPGLWVETLQVNQSYVEFLKTNINLIVENLKK